ncbi:MAG: hypothetical protein ABIQ44_05445 [Chloroflexia bacterium]
MSAVTSPIRPWHSLMTKVPYTPLLTFLLVSLPLTALSIYVLPYFEYSLPKFIWMVVLAFAVLLFQIRASMEHPTNKYLNSLTSYPITFVTLPTFFAGSLVFSTYPTVTQSVSFTFLILVTILYCVYFYLRNHQDGSAYRFLTLRGNSLVQYLLLFALIMVAVWALPNPAQAQLVSKMNGPAASWQEQLSAAQAKVTERDINAVLSRVTASSIDPLTPGYLILHFYFVTDKPVLYVVSLQDWNPAGTAVLEEQTTANVTPTPESQTADLSTLRTFLPYIKISPRDVLRLTAPDTNSGGLAWSVDLTLNVRSASLIPLWEVTLTNNSGNTPNVVQTYSILADTGVTLGSSPPK